MSERTIFVLIVRAIGMVGFGLGLVAAIGAILVLFGFPLRAGFTFPNYIESAIGYLLASLIIIVLAEVIAKAIYGRKQ
jgi:hypothetical protein